MSRRSPSRTLLLLALILAGAMPLSGCVLALGGAAAGGYTLATEDRSPSQLAKDAAIAAVAHKYWADDSTDMARDLEATVYDGRLLITGIVPKEDWRADAVKRGWQVDGVKEVYDEIQIGPDTGIVQDARDDVISNRMRLTLLGDGEIRSSNFIIHTLNGVVYILGSARSEAERTRVIGYARNLADVKRVVPFITLAQPVAPATPAAAPAAPVTRSAPPPAAEPPARPAPAGSDHIDVTPLQ